MLHTGSGPFTAKTTSLPGIPSQVTFEQRRRRSIIRRTHATRTPNLQHVHDGPFLKTGRPSSAPLAPGWGEGWHGKIRPTWQGTVAAPPWGAIPAMDPARRKEPSIHYRVHFPEQATCRGALRIASVVHLKRFTDSRQALCDSYRPNGTGMSVTEMHGRSNERR